MLLSSALNAPEQLEDTTYLEEVQNTTEYINNNNVNNLPN